VAAYFYVESNRIRRLVGKDLPAPEALRVAVARGLRARLETESLVTGTRYLNLDFRPGTPEVLRYPGRLRGPVEIPTIANGQQQLMSTLQRLLVNLNTVDFAALAGSVSRAAGGVQDLARSGDRLVRNVDPAVGRVLRELGGATRDTRRTLASMRGVLDNAGANLAANAPLPVELKQTLGSVDKAARAVTELARFLRRNPSALVLGKKSAGPATKGAQ
jgi:paraquat-inducible protein B